MLKVQRVSEYNLPKYPRFVYRKRESSNVVKLAKRGIVSAIMIAMLENCNGIGGRTTGILQVNLLTENEARVLITEVFSRNGVEMEDDVIRAIALADGDTTDLTFDGFNDSLDVGYEYISDSPDEFEFSPQVREVLDSLSESDGPYTRSIGAAENTTTGRDNLTDVIQEFVDSLKSQGII